MRPKLSGPSSLTSATDHNLEYSKAVKAAKRFRPPKRQMEQIAHCGQGPANQPTQAWKHFAQASRSNRPLGYPKAFGWLKVQAPSRSAETCKREACHSKFILEGGSGSTLGRGKGRDGRWSPRSNAEPRCGADQVSSVAVARSSRAIGSFMIEPLRVLRGFGYGKAPCSLGLVVR